MFLESLMKYFIIFEKYFFFFRRVFFSFYYHRRRRVLTYSAHCRCGGGSVEVVSKRSAGIEKEPLWRTSGRAFDMYVGGKRQKEGESERNPMFKYKFKLTPLHALELANKKSETRHKSENTWNSNHNTNNRSWRDVCGSLSAACAAL